MKKLLKILLITAVALTLALCVVACSKEPTKEVIDVIDGDAGKFEENIGTAYGAKPDLDNVVIDGILDDDLWKGKKWYTQYESTHKVKFQVTGTMSPKGMYVAATCNDNFIYWNGYNYFFSNSNFSFNFYAGNYTYIAADANNTRVTHKYLNLRSRIGGRYNIPGEGGGLTVEFFIPWEELGIDVSKGLPESVKILPLYNFASNPDTETEPLYPTFVKTTGDSGQVPRFGVNGYLDGDEENAIVGSHKGGRGRTSGWTVENSGTEQETATSSMTATSNFAQAAFFRDLTSSTFRITTKIKVKEAGKDARVGVMIYSDDVKYRAFALNLNSDNFKSGKMTEYNLRGYTNYPNRITEITDCKKMPLETPTDEIEISVYNKSGKVYYIVNGKYAYSEEASYAGLNAYAGFYTFNATAQYSNYSFHDYETEAEFDKDMAKYAYLVNIRTEGKDVTVSTDQLAVSREKDNSLIITTTFKPGYTMDEEKFEYVIGAKTESLDKLFKEKAKGGVLVLKNITGNIEIRAKARQFTNEENASNVSLKYNVKNSQTKEVLRQANVVVYGEHPYSRYTERFIGAVGGEMSVRPGEAWKYEVTSSGYRGSKGELLGGAKVNENLSEPADMFITNSIIGGIAESVLDAEGKPKTSLTASSNPGTMWDLSRESENKAVFQTSTNDRDVVYFSGRTVSDFQVAYVEIINRTDPASFSSFENDPAAGFIIKAASEESFMGLRKTGLRLKRERNNWTAGTYTDTNNVCQWDGYLGNTDRDNGGRFLNAYSGKGTVDRIPWEGKEYTNSFLMIRRGPYLYFYACDGAANVGTDAKNFGKLKLVGEFYNDLIPSYAAVGLTCTVAYNLRMDFENYWILTDENASKFIINADLDLVTPFQMTEGKKLVTLGGDALIGYDDKADTFNGSIIKDGELTLQARSISNGKMIKVTFNDGSVKYLPDTKTVLKCTPKAVNGKITATAEEVDPIVVKGTIKFPDNVPSRAVPGEVRDENDRIVAQFRSADNGNFTVRVEQGFKGTVSFSLDGYAMLGGKITGVSAENLRLEFVKSNLGGSIVFDNNTVTTVSGGNVRMNEQGLVFEYESDNSAKGNLVINNANDYKGDFSLAFTYNRFSAGTKQEDKDPSVGIRFFQGGAASLECMFIGNGYRIYHDYDNGFASRDEKRGSTISPVNMTNITNMPYDFKIIKTGSIVHMFAKQHSQANYSHVYSFDLYKFMNSTELGFTIGWFSFGYQNMVISDVQLGEVTASDLSMVASEPTIVKNEGGKMEIEGLSDNKAVVGKTYKFSVTPDSGMRVGSVKVNGKELLSAKTDEKVTLSFVAETSNKIEVVFEKIVFKVTQKADRMQTEGAKYIKAVQNGVKKTLKLVSSEAELTEGTAYIDASRNVMLYLSEGEWTLSFYRDEACTTKCGGDLKVTVVKNN